MVPEHYIIHVLISLCTAMLPQFPSPPPAPSMFACNILGNCYEVRTTPRTWTQAYDDCWDSGQMLAVIQNATMMNWIINNLMQVHLFAGIFKFKFGMVK